MPTIHSLPIELLYPILEKASFNNRVDRNLALLSVCQTWREIVARRVYSTVSIDSSYLCEHKPKALKGHYYDNISTPSFKATSNFQLAMENGMLDLVTELKIKYKLSSDAPGLLVNVMNVITAGTNGLPLFDDVRRHYVAYVNADLPSADLEDALRRDAKELARHFASILPNIRSICISGDQCHNCTTVFFGELVKCFEPQLTSLDFQAKNCFTDPVSAHQLKELGILLYAEEEPLLLSINPVPLERLNITARNLKSCWRIFTRGFDGTIGFENLKILSFGNWYWRGLSANVDQGQHVNDDTLTVTAPKLEHMTISDNEFDSKAVEWVAQSPLKSLEFNGRAHNALQLCNLLKYPLRRFELNVDISRNDSSSEVVQAVNQIMSKMQYAKHVVCVFEGDARLNLTDLSWPNLTQLKFYVPVDFSELVSKLPKMLALVLLELSLEVYYGDDAASAARFLKQLRDTYSEPIQSCVEKIYLAVGDSEDEDEDEDEDNSLIGCFMRAEDDLKWLLPKLKSLHIEYL